jgi:hypothetical protein
MDGHRFDEITRGIAAGCTRRGVLKALAGAALGAAGLAGVGGAEAAGCKPPNTKCGKGKQAQCCTSTQTCTGGQCVASNRCAGVVCVASDQCHVAGDCVPATGVCSNPPQADGAACLGGQCSGGQCVTAACPSDQTQCSDGCRSLATDANNCGACGNVCPNGSCSSGSCDRADSCSLYVHPSECTASADFTDLNAGPCGGTTSGTRCAVAVNGCPFCAIILDGKCTPEPCTSDADCGVGFICGVGASACLDAWGNSHFCARPA